MKINRQISQRVMRKWKLMFGGFLTLAFISYVKDGAIEGIMNNHFANAEEFEWEGKTYK